MKVGFVTEYTLSDPSLRSGVPFHIAQALWSAGIAYQEILVQDQRTKTRRFISRFKQWFYTRLNKNRLGRFDTAFLKSRADSFRDKIETHLTEVDLLFTINPFLVASVVTSKPIIIWIDNSFQTFHQYYLNNDLCKEVLMEGLATEAVAFKKAKKIFVASKWLQEALVSQHPAFEQKVFIMPRGANLPFITDGNEIERLINIKIKNPELNLLFAISGSWERKGGDMVLAVWKLLQDFLPVNLNVVGVVHSKDQEKLNQAGIKYWGQVDKNTQDGYTKYASAFAASHFMLLPSKADGFGITYAEAASFGVPSLAFGIMGVTEAVCEGVTGWHLPINASAQDFADIILQNWADKELYSKVCKKANQYAAKNFNWTLNICKVVKG